MELISFFLVRIEMKKLFTRLNLVSLISLGPYARASDSIAMLFLATFCGSGIGIELIDVIALKIV